MAIEPHITLAMLLTGASPPTGFVSGFATYQLNTASLKNAESAKVWSMLSFIARHPSFPEFLDQLCDAPSITSDFFDYLRIAHPCCSVEGRAPHSNKWIRALQIFKAKYRGLIPQDALERFAYFMRVDFPRDEFARLAFTAENMLPDPFLSVLLQHPAILRGECQPFNPKNPHRNAIDYFSTNEPVCHAWRFYNPLFTYPWVFEMVNDGGVPEIYACMALVGSVLIGVNKHPVFERADFRGYFPDHPSCAMVLAYLGLR